MRKPRDIDAELKALNERQRALKARKVTQLGELVAATGADALNIEVLAGALLDAVARSKHDAHATAEWKRAGAGFFRTSARGKGAAVAAQHGIDGGTSQPDSTSQG